MAALVIGPLLGLAAFWWRHGEPVRRAVAPTAVGGIVVGESLHELVRISRTDAVGWVELAVGLAAAIAVLARAAPRARLASLAAGVITAALVFLVYGETVLH